MSSSSSAGDAQAAGRDRAAVGEDVCGALRSEQVHVGGAEDSGRCSGSECGPPPRSAPPT